MPRVYKHLFNPPDHRDVIAPVADERADLSLPKQFDYWQHAPEIPRWDQGDEGDCGGFSGARATQAALQKNSVAFEGDDRVSPAFAYWMARVIMGTTSQDSGVYNRALFQALRQYGWVRESDMPYVAGQFAKKPSNQAVTDGSQHVGSNYALIQPVNGGVRASIAEGRLPVYGFAVPDYFEESSIWDPTKDYLPLPQAVPEFEKFIGGHDNVLTGWDFSCTVYPVPVFYSDNSWSEDWGQAFDAPSKKAGRWALDARWLGHSGGGQKLVTDITAVTAVK